MRSPAHEEIRARERGMNRATRRMSARAICLAICMTALAVLLTACGGDSDLQGDTSLPGDQNRPTEDVPGEQVAAGSDGSGGSSTLKAIVDRGALRVGTQFSFPNWGFYDEDREPAGFDIDMAKAMADALEVELELTETTNNNRIPYLQSGKVDVVISVFSVTPERALSVAFSQPYGALLSVLVSPSDDDIERVDDLAGKTVAVSKGTGSAALIQESAPEGTRFREFDSPASTFLALQQGQVDAAAEGLDGVNAFTEENAGFAIKGEPLRPYFPIAIGTRQRDQPLQHWIDTWLLTMENSGETERLYRKWFNIDRPPLPQVG